MCKLAPCKAHNCNHDHGPGGETWLPIDNFKVSSGGKRFKTCKEQAKSSAKYNAEKNARNNPKNNAKTSARKTQERQVYELEKNPELDLSAEAKHAAGTAAIANFEAALASTRFEHRSLACNIYGCSSGSQGFSIPEEGLKSVLTTRGGDKPAIVARTAAGGWRALTSDERRTVGSVGLELYNAHDSTVLSKHVERAVQEHVDDLVKHDGTLKKLWRVTGARAS